MQIKQRNQFTVAMPWLKSQRIVGDAKKRERTGCHFAEFQPTNATGQSAANSQVSEAKIMVRIKLARRKEKSMLKRGFETYEVKG